MKSMTTRLGLPKFYSICTERSTKFHFSEPARVSRNSSVHHVVFSQRLLQWGTNLGKNITLTTNKSATRWKGSVHRHIQLHSTQELLEEVLFGLSSEYINMVSGLGRCRLQKVADFSPRVRRIASIESRAKRHYLILAYSTMQRRMNRYASDWKHGVVVQF